MTWSWGEGGVVTWSQGGGGVREGGAVQGEGGGVVQGGGRCCHLVLVNTSPPPPFSDKMTNTCENITFARFATRAVIIWLRIIIACVYTLLVFML